MPGNNQTATGPRILFTTLHDTMEGTEKVNYLTTMENEIQDKVEYGPPEFLYRCCLFFKYVFPHPPC